MVSKWIILHPLLTLLEKTGFGKIKVKSIGDYVWKGFDKWISQGEYDETWDRNWLKGYQSGYFDYYVITAEKTS